MFGNNSYNNSIGFIIAFNVVLFLTPLIYKSQTVSFSHPTGFYDHTIYLTLSCDKREIYYTTDGSIPTINKSQRYELPIEIDSSKVIRVITADGEKVFKKIQTATFLIKESINLPVVSISIAPKNLWDSISGIYVNYRKKDDKGIVSGNLEYFNKANEPVINQQIKIKLSGNASRNYPKKSFIIKAKGKGNVLDYSFFEDKQLISEFKGLKLRADPKSVRVKNELIYEINKDLGYPVIMQAYEPVVLFLNGAYWGIYNLMERKGEGFIKNNFTKEKVDIIKNGGHVVKGDDIDYKALIKFVDNSPLKRDSIYQLLINKIDLTSYIDYWIYEIYMSKGDSYGNLRCWKTKEDTGKWRWISYDMDWWVGVKDTTLFKLTDTVISSRFNFLGKLMVNDLFRTQFFSRFNYLLDNVLTPENLVPKIDIIIDYIDKDRLRDLQRWNNSNLSLELLIKNNLLEIERIKAFVLERPAYLREHIDLFLKRF